MMDPDLVNYIFEEIKKGKSKEELFTFLTVEQSLKIEREYFEQAYLVANKKISLLNNIRNSQSNDSPSQTTPQEVPSQGTFSSNNSINLGHGNDDSSNITSQNSSVNNNREDVEKNYFSIENYKKPATVAKDYSKYSLGNDQNQNQNQNKNTNQNNYSNNNQNNHNTGNQNTTQNKKLEPKKSKKGFKIFLAIFIILLLLVVIYLFILPKVGIDLNLESLFKKSSQEIDNSSMDRDLVAVVSATPKPGNYSEKIDVSFSTDLNDAVIYYSLDEKDIITNGLLYTAPISIDKNTVVNVVASKDGSLSETFYFNYLFVVDSNNVSNDNNVVETCSDGIKNQDETGVDCGGVCQPCPDQDQNLPSVETCSDGIKNQDETGVDCGGVCQPCLPAGGSGGGSNPPVNPPVDVTFCDSDIVNYSKTINGPSKDLLKTADNKLLVIGNSVNNNNSYITKLNSDYTLVWDHNYPASNIVFNSITETTNGYLVTGSLDNKIALFKISLDGDLDWNKSYNYSNSVAHFITKTGTSYIVGGSYSNVDSFDFLLIKVNEDGQQISQFTKSVFNNDYYYKAVTDNSYIYLLGKSNLNNNNYDYISKNKISDLSEVWSNIIQSSVSSNQAIYLDTENLFISNLQDTFVGVDENVVLDVKEKLAIVNVNKADGNIDNIYYFKFSNCNDCQPIGRNIFKKENSYLIFGILNNFSKGVTFEVDSTFENSLFEEQYTELSSNLDDIFVDVIYNDNKYTTLNNTSSCLVDNSLVLIDLE